MPQMPRKKARPRKERFRAASAPSSVLLLSPQIVLSASRSHVNLVIFSLSFCAPPRCCRFLRKAGPWRAGPEPKCDPKM
jgi:hypothetical protein